VALLVPVPEAGLGVPEAVQRHARDMKHRVVAVDFNPETLERQLTEVAAECVSHAQCATIDRAANKMAVSSVFSWRSKEFSAAYSDKAPPAFGTRSPIERAVLAFVDPMLTLIERNFLARNEFSVEFSRFDWTLNDLTGRGGR